MSKLSRETFIEQINNGELKSKRHRVYAYLQKNDIKTLDHLRKSLSMSHPTLTARLSELMDVGMVWQNVDNEFYITNERDWDYYANLRMEQRYQKWLNVGKKEGWIN